MTARRDFHAIAAARPWLLAAALVLLTGCSIRQTAVNMIGDALSGGGSVYASDDDPELIREALPFGLKTFETLLAVSPAHQGLLLAAARGFAVYAYLLQDQADRLDAADLGAAERLRERAGRLYLRGRDYAVRELESRSPGLLAQLKKDPTLALRNTGIDDIPFLYWGGAAWAGAVATAKNDPALLIDLPAARALVERVLELDEGYDNGAARELMISFEAGRPGGSLQIARAHYQQAIRLSRGAKASVYVALAESVALREQNLAEFKALIEAALAVDPENAVHLRLANTVAQHRARWLQSRIPELFLEADAMEDKPR